MIIDRVERDGLVYLQVYEGTDPKTGEEIAVDVEGWEDNLSRSRYIWQRWLLLRLDFILKELSYGHEIQTKRTVDTEVLIPYAQALLSQKSVSHINSEDLLGVYESLFKALEDGTVTEINTSIAPLYGSM